MIIENNFIFFRFEHSKLDFIKLSIMFDDEKVFDDRKSSLVFQKKRIKFTVTTSSHISFKKHPMSSNHMMNLQPINANVMFSLLKQFSINYRNWKNVFNVQLLWYRFKWKQLVCRRVKLIYSSHVGNILRCHIVFYSHWPILNMKFARFCRSFSFLSLER